MIGAFYNSKSGAIASQEYINVISNNISNVQTNGFKKGSADFSELLNQNIRGVEMGNGTRLEKVKTVHGQGYLSETGIDTDFAVNGEGYFAVQFGNETRFTRDGSFAIGIIEDEKLLTYQGGFVLDAEGNHINVDQLRNKETEIGIFKFENREHLVQEGNNLFRATDQAVYGVEEGAEAMEGFIEGSNVDLGEEMVKLMHMQKLFQLSTKLIQTSDEIEQTINSLK